MAEKKGGYIKGDFDENQCENLKRPHKVSETTCRPKISLLEGLGA